jgi:glucose/arabinose dehydrogenase
MPHPDFAGNHRVYLSFVESGPNGTSGAALGYGTLTSRCSRPALRDFKVIRQQPKVTGDGHFSHRIAFGPDGLLYLSSGERQKMARPDLNGNPADSPPEPEGGPALGNPWAGAVDCSNSGR